MYLIEFHENLSWTRACTPTSLNRTRIENPSHLSSNPFNFHTSDLACSSSFAGGRERTMQARWLAKLGRDLISSRRPSRFDLPSRCLASMALSVNPSLPKPVSSSFIFAARSRRNQPPGLGFYPPSPLLPVRFYINSAAFSSIYFLIEICHL